MRNHYVVPSYSRSVEMCIQLSNRKGSQLRENASQATKVREYLMSKSYRFSLRTTDYVLTASYDLHNGFPHSGRTAALSSRVSPGCNYGLCEQTSLLLLP